MESTSNSMLKTPGVRPLETLHNALSLHQLDQFFEKILTTNYRPSGSTINLSNSNESNLLKLPESKFLTVIPF